MNRSRRPRFGGDDPATVVAGARLLDELESEQMQAIRAILPASARYGGCIGTRTLPGNFRTVHQLMKKLGSPRTVRYTTSVSEACQGVVAVAVNAP